MENGKGTIFMSVETLRLAQEVDGGWENLSDLGVSVVGLIDMDGRFQRYLGENDSDIRELSLRLRKADILVGYGVKRFDIEVLTAVFPQARILKARSLDLMDCLPLEKGKRVSLRNLIRHTLGKELASGVQSPLEWRSGNRGQVLRRLRSKLDAVKELYRIARSGGEWSFVEMVNGEPLRRDVRVNLAVRFPPGGEGEE